MVGYGNQPVKHREIVTGADVFPATSRLQKELPDSVFLSLTMPD